MAVSRRSLLRNSVFAAVAYAAGPLQAWSAKKASSTNSPGQNNSGKADRQSLDRDAFTDAVGSAFKVTPSSGKGDSVWLRLLAVEDLPALVPVNEDLMDVAPPAMRTVTTTGFVLSFLGTLPEPLPQGTYTFEHPELGTFSLLIV